MAKDFHRRKQEAKRESAGEEGEEGRQCKVPLKIKREMGFGHELHAGGRDLG